MKKILAIPLKRVLFQEAIIVDHKKAWANGGETVLENLETLCSKCNIGKSDLE